MTGTEFDPTELDFVIRQLSIIGNFDKNELPAIMEKVADELLKQVQTQPPPLKYIRTGRYKESTFKETKAVRNGIEAIAGSHGAIRNGTRYDPFLKDARNQAAIHKGRWTTLQEDVEAVMPFFEQQVMEALEALKL